MDKVIIQVVVSTLEDIEVHGKDNLSKLLGCINALENILNAEAPKEHKDGEEVNNGR